ncbi:MAG: hypothetical protein JSV58_02265 [Candidatus Bathyarchaeota archaeon]|nr:MAG: hypothetical protein JSV58_02265 [Candidatus Bathyarchaeota archaeon]
MAITWHTRVNCGLLMLGRIQARRASRLLVDKRAVSNVISAVILTGAVIALSLAVFSWSESRSLDYSREYGETVDAETAKLRERLVFEYVSYNNPTQELSLYMLNCGTVDDVKIKAIHITKSALLESFSNPTLNLLDGTQAPDQDLDIGEEAYFVLSLSSALSSGYYSIEIITVRGATFHEDFIV